MEDIPDFGEVTHCTRFGFIRNMPNPILPFRQCRRLSCPKLVVLTVLVLASIFIFNEDFPISGSNKTRNKGLFQTAFRKMVGGKSSSLYDERKNSLLQACSVVSVHEYERNSEAKVRDHFVVDRRNKILFCGMEKVGCTFWKRFFQITTGVKKKKNPFDIKSSGAHDHSLETLRSLHFYEILEIVNSFTRFIFVREPYSRIFSGYVDKMFSPNSPYFYWRQKIKQNSQLLNESDCAPDISFRDFLPYVLNSLKTNSALDGHFVPMYDHCKPCALRYDVIGKMETFTSDVEYLIQSQNLMSVVEVNLTGLSRETDTIRDAFSVAYGGRKAIEKCMTFIKALKLIWRQLQIRGIIEKQVPFPSQFQQGRVPSKEEAILETIKASEGSDPVRKKGNKREALIEAFQSVSAKDLAEYRDIFDADFKLFGYDIEPKDVFSENIELSNFSYFRI